MASACALTELQWRPGRLFSQTLIDGLGTRLHAYTLSLLIKRNAGGGGGGGGGVTPGLNMALLPLASLWLCMLPLASLWLCYPMQASLWLCYLCMASLYGSVTPGLNMNLLPLASIWICYPWPIYSSCVCD